MVLPDPGSSKEKLVRVPHEAGASFHDDGPASLRRRGRAVGEKSPVEDYSTSMTREAMARSPTLPRMKYMPVRTRAPPASVPFHEL